MGLNRDDAEDGKGVFYNSALLHEMGHSWGLETKGTEDYQFNIPTVMHGGGGGSVQDTMQIHVRDAYLIRRNYDDQKDIPTLYNMSVTSKYADASTLSWKNSTTDKTQYRTGESITVYNLTVENTGTVASSHADLLLYLSPDRTITTSDYLIGSFTWSNFPAESYQVFSLEAPIPDSVPGGTYYVGAMVKCDCMPMWGFDELEFDDTTHLYRTIDIVGPPAAPSNLQTTGVCNGVKLTWTDNSNNESRFEIYRGSPRIIGMTYSCSGIIYSFQAIVGLNIQEYTDTAAPGPVYCYYVASFNENGRSASPSKTGSALKVPAAPATLTAAAASSNQINLAWTNVTNETGYKIERAPDNAGNPGTFAQIGTVGADVTTFQDVRLSPNTQYWYRVRAYNTCGDSAYSNVITASTTTSTTSTKSTTSTTGITTSTTTISPECTSDDDCEDDGVFCNGHEICTLEERCVSSGNPCPEGTECIEEDEICREEPPPDTCELSIYPPNESVFTGETIQFSAMESGNCTTPCYTWEVVGGTGDTTGSMGSTIDSSGWYTAGYTSGTDIVIVTDSCNYDISALSIVTVEESPVTTTSTTISSTTTTACICPVVCVFGMSSEEAELLRYLRDHVLSQTPEGQELIRLYYEWSPVVLKAMQNDEEFKAQVKETIDGVLPLIR